VRSFAPRDLVSRALANPLFRRVVKNSGYLVSANALATAGSMLQGALAVRIVGVEGLGVLGIVTDFASNVNRLTSFRMSQLVVRYVGEFSAAQDEARAAAVFKAAGIVETVSSIVAVALILLLAPLAADYIVHDPATTDLFRLYGLAILGNLVMESSTGLLQVADRFHWLAWITVGSSVFTLVMMFLAFVTQGSLTEVVLVYAIGKAIGAIFVMGLAVVEAGRRWGRGWWKAKLSLLAPRWKEMARFATSTNIATTITLITRDSELLWLGLLTNPVQVGYYKVARALSGAVFLPVEPMVSTTYRETSVEVSHRRWPNVRYLFRSGSLLAAAWTLAAVFGLAVFGPWLIRLIYTPESLPAYPVLVILLVGVAIVNIFYWNRSLLMLLGMPQYPNWVHGIVGAGKIIGSILWVPIGGAVAMAGMLSGYFAVTTTILVRKSIQVLHRAEVEQPPPAVEG
jgi:O-antigen/teichoic acid export membrane protein